MRSFKSVRQVRIGAAVLRPQLNRLQSNGSEVRLQPKVVETLVYLAGRQGEVVSRGELLDHVWEGTFVKEEAVTTVVSQARRAFGGSAKDSPIETVPKRGYRLVAPVEFISEDDSEPQETAPASPEHPSTPTVSRWPAAALSAAVRNGKWRLALMVVALTIISLAFATYHTLVKERAPVNSGMSAAAAALPGKPTPPMGADQLLDQGLHFLQQDNFLANENAVSLFLQSLREDPEHAQAHLGLAQALQSRVGKYGYSRSLLETAARHAREAARLNPRSGHVQRTLGDLERQQGRFDDALKAYLAAAELQPEDGRTAKQVGLLYKRSRTLDQALQWLQIAQDRSPRDAQIASEIGFIYLSLDQLEDAEAWLSRAIELEPMGAAHRARLSTVYLLQGMWDEAESPCQDLLAHLPDNIDCLISLGERAALLGQSEEADQYFKRILARQPEHPYVHLRRAHLMLQNGHEDEAHHLLDQIEETLLERKDEHWTHFWVMAAVASLKGEPQEAAHWLDRTFKAGRLLFRWDASDPAFHPIKGSPGYQQYLDNMKERVSDLRRSTATTKLTRSFSQGI